MLLNFFLIIYIERSTLVYPDKQAAWFGQPSHDLDFPTFSDDVPGHY
jgi:hypothetical protein